MTKVLILCVDRDDDLGKKANVKGPIIGKEKNIKAATALLEADPGESDANTIFEAVKVYDELGKDALEVVTITGHSSRGYKSDKEILAQLEEVIKTVGKPDGCFLVTDGRDDDEVIPIIHSKMKILSKRTLIIKQAKELEKSYYVLKQLMHEPTFARIIFGLPGITILTIAFLEELGFKIIMLIIGIYLMLKGFGVEEPIINAARSFRETTSIERPSSPLYIGALLTLVLSVIAGNESLSTVPIASGVVKQAASFIGGFINLFIIAMVLFFTARVGDMHFTREFQKIKKHLRSIVTVLAIWLVSIKAIELILGKILLGEFMGWVAAAFAGTIIGVNIMNKIYTKKYIVSRLKKDLEVYDAKGAKLGKIEEVSYKNKTITVAAEKEEKKKIPFKKIIVIKEYVAVSL